MTMISTATQRDDPASPVVRASKAMTFSPAMTVGAPER
jgi:hypothetical protein